MKTKSYLALIAIDLKLALRRPAVIIFNYLFPLMFFFLFGLFFGGPKIIQVLSMSIALGVLGNGLFGAGLRAIQERELGILRRYKVTPISPIPLLLGSMVTGWTIFLPYIVVIFWLAHALYHMPWPANMLSILVFISIGQIAFRAIGLVIASVANSMQEGTVLVQLCYFPMLFLSGATFPLDRFPGFMKGVPKFIPATYLVNGVQDLMVSNYSLLQERKAIVSLLITIVVGLFVGMKLFRWEKDEKIRTSAKLWLLAVLLPFLIMGIWQMHK